MPFTTTADGAELFYKDWGAGRPVVFLHGWPLTSDVWDRQLKLVADAGYRGIATDRRGHGRSTQTWSGHDMNTYADDLGALLTELDLHDVVLVGHSAGGGVLARFCGRYGTQRIAKAVLAGAVTPHLMPTATNPVGAPAEVFAGLRAGLISDRSDFFRHLAVLFYGANREGATVSSGALDAFWQMSITVGLAAAFDCVAAFSETDFTADLQAMDIPVLVTHGDDDQIVPLAISGPHTAALLPHGELRVYSGAPHGLVGDFEEEFEKDLLAFLAT